MPNPNNGDSELMGERARTKKNQIQISMSNWFELNKSQFGLEYYSLSFHESNFIDEKKRVQLWCHLQPRTKSTR